MEKQGWQFRKTIDAPNLLAFAVVFAGMIGAWYDVNHKVETNAIEVTRTNEALAEFKTEYQTMQADNQTRFTRIGGDMTALAVSNGRIEATMEYILQSVDDIKDSVGN